MTLLEGVGIAMRDALLMNDPKCKILKLVHASLKFIIVAGSSLELKGQVVGLDQKLTDF